MSSNQNKSCNKAEAHAVAQRERILNAAQECFIKHGFHAASMASIAETAQISIGLIYRYFQNKNAIILAIVDRQIELLVQDIKSTAQFDLPLELSKNYGVHSPRDGRGLSAALMLEMSAEATRDPEIAQALHHFDDTLRQAIVDDLIESDDSKHADLSVEAAKRRALMLQCLIEGLKVRETREPHLDREQLHLALKEALPALMR